MKAQTTIRLTAAQLALLQIKIDRTLEKLPGKGWYCLSVSVVGNDDDGRWSAILLIAKGQG